MRNNKNNNWKNVAAVLKNGEVAVIPTDTLYGLVGSAYNKKTVEKIYDLKGRDNHKPLIVLVSSFDTLSDFGVRLTHEQESFLSRIWPGKVSVILSCGDKKFTYLHRGTKTIAFRMIGPRNKNLFNILKKVGPLVAPSANPQGEIPAETIAQAKKYFKNRVGLYVGGGKRNSKPSTLVDYTAKKYTVLRKGAVRIK
jgi:L-threonylcarbamoyladenylate synthase